MYFTEDLGQGNLSGRMTFKEQKRGEIHSDKDGELGRGQIMPAFTGHMWWHWIAST